MKKNIYLTIPFLFCTLLVSNVFANHSNPSTMTIPVLEDTYTSTAFHCYNYFYSRSKGEMKCDLRSGPGKSARNFGNDEELKVYGRYNTIARFDASNFDSLGLISSDGVISATLNVFVKDVVSRGDLKIIANNARAKNFEQNITGRNQDDFLSFSLSPEVKEYVSKHTIWGKKAGKGHRTDENSWLSIDVTELLKSNIDRQHESFTLMMFTNKGKANNEKFKGVFGSREGKDGQYAMNLEVKYIANTVNIISSEVGIFNYGRYVSTHGAGEVAVDLNGFDLFREGEETIVKVNDIKLTAPILGKSYLPETTETKCFETIYTGKQCREVSIPARQQLIIGLKEAWILNHHEWHLVQKIRGCHELALACQEHESRKVYHKVEIENAFGHAEFYVWRYN